MQCRRREFLASYLVVTTTLAVRLPAQGIKLPYPMAQIEARARRDSNDAEAQYLLGLGYWNAKRYDDAERTLKLSVTIDPRFAPGYLALGVLALARRTEFLKRLGNRPVPDSVREALIEAGRLEARAFLLDPLVDPQVFAAVLPVHGSTMVFDRRSRIWFIVTFPFADFFDGRYESMFMTLQDVMLRYPGAQIPSSILWYHGLSAAHLGHYPEAISDFQTLLDRSVQQEQSDSIQRIPLATNDYRYLLALFKQRSNKPADAMALYKEALANDIGLFMAHVQMGKIYEAHQMWPEAIEEFRQAVSTNPDDPSLLLDLGVVLREAGQRAEAADLLRRAEAANPRDSRVPYHLGITLQEQQDTAAARVELARFLALAPSRYDREIADARQRLSALH